MINKTYDNVYAEGEDLDKDDDFFFDVTFDTGRVLRFGPADGVTTLPVNSGSAGGGHVPLPLSTSRGPLRQVELAH